MRPLLIVICGPSGSGKSTLCDRLRAERADLVYSVSCTTRPPRGAEIDGKDYYFLTEEQFERCVSQGLFLEHALVHGHRYGTLKETVLMAIKGGKNVLMDIDVQGARQIRGAAMAGQPGDRVKDGLVDVFVNPPSMAVLRKRLELRAEDAPETIERRLKNAETEMASAGEFKYILVNDVLETAFAGLMRIIDNESTISKR